MSEQPEITIVIPTYGYRRFLPMTLASALAQEGVSLELVVIDDGSGEITAARLGLANERRLRVLRHDSRRGVAASRNTGVDAARGEWLALLDDDDLWAPQKLRRQVDAARSEGASFAYGAALFIDEHGRPIRHAQPPPAPADLLVALLRVNAMPAPGSNVVVKTELVRGLGGFDEDARFDDWDMWIRLSAAARAARRAEVLTAYRLHPANRILATQDEVIPGVRYLAQKHRDLSVRHGVEFDEAALGRWAAHAYGRAGTRLRAAWMYAKLAAVHRSPSDLVRAALAPLGSPRVRPWRAPVRPPSPPWLAAYQEAPSTSPRPDR